jgi:hypothetical protein
MIPPVHQGYPYTGTLESSGRIEAPEPTAQNDDMR